MRTVEPIRAYLYFRPGHPAGSARSVATFHRLTVVPCDDTSCCGGFDREIVADHETRYRVVLEPCSRRKDARETHFYKAHREPETTVSNFESQFRSQSVTIGNSGIQLLFLGGLGSAGSATCIVLAHGDSAIMIDCGVTVALLEHDTDKDEFEGTGEVLPGIYPEFDLIKQSGLNIAAIFVTHAHLDHYGGLPEYLSRDSLAPHPPIYSGRFTTEIIAHHLNENDIPRHSVSLPVLQENQTVEVGPFKVKALPVFHSVPGSLGFAVWLKGAEDERAIVFTGDMKCSLESVSDLFDTIAVLGGIGPVKLLLCDCTNATREGLTELEASVEGGFLNAIMAAPGRVFVSLFSTHINRIRRLAALSNLTRKRLSLLGQSFEGPLDALDATGVTISFQRNPEGAQIIAIAGCQANETSTAWRLSQGDQVEGIRIVTGDTIVISALPIPGRGAAVSAMIKGFRACGAHVIVDNGYPEGIYGPNISREAVHVSGHGSAHDIKAVIEATEPKYILPYHCGRKEAVQAAEIALSSSVFHLTDERIVLVEANGTIINI